MGSDDHLLGKLGRGTDAVVGLSTFTGFGGLVSGDNNRAFKAFAFDDEELGGLFGME